MSPCDMASLVQVAMAPCGARHGAPLNPGRPEPGGGRAAAEKIRLYRSPDARNRAVAFMPACMSTAGRIQSEFLRLLFIIADRGFSEEGGRWGTGSGTEAAAGTGLGSGSPTTRETSPPLTSMRSPSRGRSSLHCSLEHWHRQVHASSYVCRNMNE